MDQGSALRDPELMSPMPYVCEGEYRQHQDGQKREVQSPTFRMPFQESPKKNPSENDKEQNGQVGEKQAKISIFDIDGPL